MKKQHTILHSIILVMAVIVMAAHIMPTSLQLLDPEFCVSMNLTDSELEEEEKELVQLAAAENRMGTMRAQAYADHSEAFPSTPYLETLSLPPDFN